MNSDVRSKEILSAELFDETVLASCYKSCWLSHLHLIIRAPSSPALRYYHSWPSKDEREEQSRRQNPIALGFTSWQPPMLQGFISSGPSNQPL